MTFNTRLWICRFDVSDLMQEERAVAGHPSSVVNNSRDVAKEKEVITVLI